MRPYFTPIFMTVCLGSIAIVQAVKDLHWSDGYAIAVVLAGCAGFNWWWTFNVRSPRPPMVPAYVAGWTAFIEAGVVAVSIATLAILAAFVAWRLVQ